MFLLLFSCVGVSNDVQLDFVEQLQRKEERSHTQQKIRIDQRENLQENAQLEWNDLSSCMTDPRDSCIDQIRQYVAQFEYAVAESSPEGNLDSVQSVRVNYV